METTKAPCERNGGSLVGTKRPEQQRVPFLKLHYEAVTHNQDAAAYRQNVANCQAHDDLLSRNYRNQRNQAAAQNDLQRMYMAEMGGARGLNTGAAGQLALAQSAAYQGSLEDLWAAESQDRAENDLALRNLAAAYQGDMASAAAQSNSQLAQALYSEYVRQIQAAQAQANWQAQFDYQQAQDALDRQQWQTQWDASRQADRQSTAYKMASAMLENGLMPDSGTLTAAGISQADAQAYVNAVQAQLAAQAARSAVKTTPYKTSPEKPRLTYAQALSAINDGQITDAVRQAYDYYMGDGAFDQYYGGQAGTAEKDGSGPSNQASPVIRSLTEQLNSGNESRTVWYLDSLWDSLTEAQKQEVRAVLDRYGMEYEG